MYDELDIQTVEQTPDVENVQMEQFAKLGAQLLGKHYPRHLWYVGWFPGMGLCIKLMSIVGPGGRYGFTVDVAGAASISEVEKAIVFGGGELLERCGAPRGAWNGEFLDLKDKS